MFFWELKVFSKMKKKISIIVPVYNVEKYVCRCIDSILNQSYQDYELIIINDGSVDKSGEICEYYRQLDKRINVRHQENKGLSAARNAGLDIAQGDYITFIDSDDYVYPEYLEKLLKAVEKNKADIGICGNIRFSNNIDPKVIKNYEDEKIITRTEACMRIYEGEKDSVNYVVAWGKLYKRDLFVNHRFPVGKLHEDQFLTYKLMYNSFRIVEIGECLYGYYINENGIMNAPFNIKRYDSIEAYEEAEQFFKNNKEFDIGKKIYDEKMILLAQNFIRSKKAGISNHVPEYYRMNFWKAKKIIREIGGIDRYEYFMYQYYSPRLITFEARLRKIKRIITRTDN